MLNFRKFYLNLLILVLAAICHSVNIELKLQNYEVDILQTPIKREESPYVTHVTSIHGQQYQCILPQIEDDEKASEKETDNEKNTDIKELLKPMKTGSCLLKGKDWWTYEFCFGHYIKQFHIEDGQIIGPVITLGLYESDYDWNNETDQEKFKHVKQRYHSQFYVNGTKCDLTGQPRNAEVRMFCEEDAGDYISRVDEPGTCSYIITIHTSRLCAHPQLKPLPSKKAHSIACQPSLNEEQYSSYLQKLNEEKEKSEQRRNQWLNNQHERLQVMKNENVLQLKKDSNKVKDTSKKANEESTLIVVDNLKYGNAEKELDELKSSVPPEQYAKIVDKIQKHFSHTVNEIKDQNTEITEASVNKLSTQLHMLLKKLDKSEDVLEDKQNKEEQSQEVSDEIPEETTQKNAVKEEKDETPNENVSKTTDNKQSSTLDDDELHVRIRRLDRRPTDNNGKLYEMDIEHRKKLEQAVKEKLEKAGLDVGGRRIEVKIITSGYYDNEEGKPFHSLFSDEETNQFQNMIMALLTGQQEAVQEIERHKKLEENYKFTWENEEDED